MEEVRDYKEYVLEHIYLLNSKIDIFVGYYLKKRKEKKEKKRDREREEKEKKRIKRFYLVRLRGNCKKGRGNRRR